jgi:hypothetical protein
MSDERNVFINCPFDRKYRALLRAILFAVHDCGFRARSALEVEDSGEVRVQKILRIISESPFGIHDISRVEPDRSTNLPRFNMPLELGLFLGAKAFGVADQQAKRCIVLDEQPYRYRSTARTLPARTFERTTASRASSSKSFVTGCRRRRRYKDASFRADP